MPVQSWADAGHTGSHWLKSIIWVHQWEDGLISCHSWRQSAKVHGRADLTQDRLITVLLIFFPTDINCVTSLMTFCLFWLLLTRPRTVSFLFFFMQMTENKSLTFSLLLRLGTQKDRERLNYTNAWEILLRESIILKLLVKSCLAPFTVVLVVSSLHPAARLEPASQLSTVQHYITRAASQTPL